MQVAGVSRDLEQFVERFLTLLCKLYQILIGTCGTLHHCLSERCEDVDLQLKLSGPVIATSSLDSSEKSFTPLKL